MVVMEEMGEFRMCLVGRANSPSSGLNMGWDGDVDGKPIFVTGKNTG